MPCQDFPCQDFPCHAINLRVHGSVPCHGVLVTDRAEFRFNSNRQRALILRTSLRDALAQHGPGDPEIYGTARHGKSWHGKSWHGTARKILARKILARHGTAWHGKRLARHGPMKSWHGNQLARHGTARQRSLWHGTPGSGTWHEIPGHGTEYSTFPMT